MITAPALRRDLNESLAVTPNVLAQTIKTQSAQLDDQMTITANAWRDGDLEVLERASANLHAVVKSLRENLELQMKSRATVPEASTAVLIAELHRRAKEEKDVEAREALKLPVTKKAGAGRGRV